MLDMTVRNLPRGCGKTTIIKLAIAEMALDPALKAPRIVVVTPYGNLADMYRRWAKAYNIDITAYTHKPNLRGIREDLTVFIDEPFALPEQEQYEMLEEFELLSSTCDITIYALGTLPESTDKPTFKDYL